MANHDGHRERMRDRIINCGIDSLQNHEILEYLLYACIPRKDTNAIAHDLIDTFGGFANVLDADIEHLSAVPNMTTNAALLLHSIPFVFSKYLTSKHSQKLRLDKPEYVMEYMRYTIGNLPKEEMRVLCKDNRGFLINTLKLSQGDINSCALPIRELIEIAIKNKAASVILAHNHPSQGAQPSQSDIIATREAAVALAGSKIKLDDHIIVCGQEVYSMRDNGLLDYLQDGSLQIKLSGGHIQDIKY